MKKIKRLLLSAAALLMLLSLVACGSSQKMPDELLKTAIRKEDNYNGDKLSITDFQVENRNYDSDYKTESVTVEIQAENEDSSYKASYEVMGQYENHNWGITSILKTDSTVLPKKPLSQAVVDRKVEQFLSNEKNVQYNLTQVNYCNYSDALEPNIAVDVQLGSNTQYVSTTRNYRLVYQYTLNGWVAIEESEDDIQVQITDDLCGTWVASNGEDSYKFVIDHIEGDTAYVKYQAQFRMPVYGWSSQMISRGYDTLTPVSIAVVVETYPSVKIVFENTKSNDSYFYGLLKVGIRIFPNHCPQVTYANGTVEDGKAYVLTDVRASGIEPPNGTCILTKQ